MIKCNKCNFENEDGSNYCRNCANKLILPKPENATDIITKTKMSSYAKNYKKIFNWIFYPVIGIIVLFILTSLLGGGFYALGNLSNIVLNIWIWLFIIFIFLFRKYRRTWLLVISIILGIFTILAAFSPYITHWLNS